MTHELFDAIEELPRPDRLVITFEVHGSPQTQGSKIAQVIYRRDGNGQAQPVKTKTGRILTVARDDNPKTKDWRLQVADAARRAYGGPLLTGAVDLAITFYRPRPKSHYGKRGLKASAPARPTTKPDSSKMLRAVEDALSKVIWVDDSQVVDHELHKRFGDHAYVAVRVESLDGETDQP